jgi:ubiquitin-protein ligase
MSYAGRLARPLQDHLSPKWLKADIEVTTMLSVNEVVLDKSAFVKEQPFLVINNTEMVQTRYLIINTVKGMEVVNSTVNVPKPLPDVAYNEVAKEYQLYRDSNYQSLNTVTGTGIVHVPKDCFSISRNAKTTKKEVSQLELPSYASSIATKHLQRELRKILKTNSDATAVFSLDRTKLDNLYTWHVYLQNFASDLPLAQDLQRLSLPNIQLEIKFGPQHPHTPPFIRVVQPRFLAFSHGGGGHVTAGGSICMSMLTMDDWSPVYSMSQVLIAVHSALSSIDPQPAKIADRGRYQEHEAMAAYVRVATTHGWSVPQGWTTLFNGTAQTNA